ncbi:BBE domain-containing protein [Streptomyces sp. NPDC059761]
MIPRRCPDTPDSPRSPDHGANSPRLVEIKKGADPEGFFSVGQAIGS